MGYLLVARICVEMSEGIHLPGHFSPGCYQWQSRAYPATWKAGPRWHAERPAPAAPEMEEFVETSVNGQDVNCKGGS